MYILEKGNHAEMQNAGPEHANAGDTENAGSASYCRKVARWKPDQMRSNKVIVAYCGLVGSLSRCYSSMPVESASIKRAA